jgi:hypothetical protein
MRIETASQIAALYRGRVAAGIEMDGELHTDDFPRLTYRAYRSMYEVRSALARAPVVVSTRAATPEEWHAATGLPAGYAIAAAEMAEAIQWMAAGNLQRCEDAMRAASGTWRLEPHAVWQRSLDPHQQHSIFSPRTGELELRGLLDGDPWDPNLRDALADRREAVGDIATALSLRAMTALALPFVEPANRLPPPGLVLAKGAKVDTDIALPIAEIRELWLAATWVRNAHPDLAAAWLLALTER